SLLVLVILFCSVFFFFQAEDGIRDFHVTGVQTCALPILFLDGNTGFAVGAYGLMLRTDDAGATWTAVPITAQSEAEADEEEVAEADDSWTFSDEDLMLEEESNPHLNGTAVTGSGALFIAAARGSAYR